MMFEQDQYSATPLMVLDQNGASLAYPMQTKDGLHPQPRSLKRRNLRDWAPLLVQASLTIFPILFIGLAVTALILDEKSTSPLGKKSPTGATVERVMKLSPTIFPIIFAAIIGKFFRTLGLYLAQRRIRLGTLERLVGSQSLFASIERQLSLRGSYLIGLGIIALWTLSPIGGQSALRLLGSTPALVFSNNTVIRYEPIETQIYSVIDGASSLDSSWSMFSSTFTTSLKTFPLVGNTKRDIFGNAKTPRPDSTYLLPPEIEGDFSTIDYNQNISYTSMLGLPTNGVPQVGNSTFNIPSRYFAVDCSKLDKFSGNSSGAEILIPTASSFKLNATMSDFGSIVPGQVIPFTFVSMGSTSYSYAECTLTARNIESRVICYDGICQVDAMRNQSDDTGYQEMDPVFISNLFSTLPIAMQGPRSGYPKSSTLTEFWIQDPNTTFNNSYTYVDMYTVPLATFSKNLEAVINTFGQSTYSYDLLTGDFPADDLSYNVDSSINITLGHTTAKVTRFDGEVYICNRIFAALLIVISSILLLGGLSSLVLMNLTLAPDTFGYVSSSTRDNPYFTRSAPSYLDGMERAKAMSGMLVIMGDVRSEMDVGHIAFTSEINAQPLQRGRLYD